MVLIGTNETTPESEPEIKPELQNRSVISVAVGDWHNAALTSDGKVLTWGEFSSGALGLGDPAKLEPGTPGGYERSPANQGRRRRTPPTVNTPTQVRFDHGAKSPRDRFAFAITAAGWHTGALVMDLNVGPFLVSLHVHALICSLLPTFCSPKETKKTSMKWRKMMSQCTRATFPSILILTKALPYYLHLVHSELELLTDGDSQEAKVAVAEEATDLFLINYG